MRSVLAVGGLTLAVLGGLALPAGAAPVPQPPPRAGAPSGRPAGPGRITNLPQSLQRDKVVSALVQLDGDPVALQRAQAAPGFDGRRAERALERRQDATLPALEAAGAQVHERLGTVLNAVRVRAKVRDLDAIAAVPGVRAVQVSRVVRRANARSAQFTGVDQTWQDLGLTGKGQVIGVVDTGVDYTHADFGGPGTRSAFANNDGAVVEPGSFPTAKVTGGHDFVGDDYDASAEDDSRAVPHPDDDPLDCQGHGSHVAGTAAGGGVDAQGRPYTGPYTEAALSQRFDVAPGAAPQATLKAYRVFGCDGSAGDDIIIAAIDRAVADGVGVVNLSLAAPYGTAHDLETEAIEAATEAGVLVVTAAGNSGSGAYVVGSPATADAALAVAAVDAEPTSGGAANPGYGKVAGFSAGGPRRSDSAQKPDVAAPGVSIPSVALGTGTGSTRLSGTSMATPHTAGIAALVRQAHRSWTPLQVKAAIMSTALPTKIEGYDSGRAGTGLVQPRRAAAAKAYAWTSTGLNSLTFGMNQLSGSYRETQSFKITNRSKSAITYTLSSTLSSARRGAAVSIEPSTLTVKAGATRTVAVTISLSKADVAALPGASSSDGGRLISLRGVVTAKPKGSHTGIVGLRTAFVAVPVPLSVVKASTTVSPTASGYSGIKVTNSGVHTGTADGVPAAAQRPGRRRRQPGRARRDRRRGAGSPAARRQHRGPDAGLRGGAGQGHLEPGRARGRPPARHRRGRPDRLHHLRRRHRLDPQR